MNKPMATRRPLWADLLQQAIAVGGLILSLKLCMHYLDPYKEQREQAKKRAQFLKKTLGKTLELNEFEQLLAANVVNPLHIDVTVEEVNGLDAIIEELELKVLYPLQKPELYCTTLWKQTKGVLFYGPPGTGKTMLAKALAKQSGCFFLNITASSILSKWLGDASRLVRAVFTLAQKLQPCIIFIDEVEAMLGKRGGNQEHEATLQVKTEFMQLWDGMESNRGQRVVVMGATNRPWMVDEAVLRRFSTQYEIGLPNQDQRHAILKGYIHRHHSEMGDQGVSQDLLEDRPDEGGSGEGSIAWIAANTEGFSGSDLVELCSNAAQRVLSEYWVGQRVAAQARGEGPSSIGSASTMSASSSVFVRSVTRTDFEEALKLTQPATHKADEYRSKGEGHSGSNAGDLMSLIMKMAAATGSGGDRNNNK